MRCACLPDDMRADLLQALLESFNLSEELDPEFCAELVRRYEEAKNDPSKLRSHDEVMREARARLARVSDR